MRDVQTATDAEPSGGDHGPPDHCPEATAVVPAAMPAAPAGETGSSSRSQPGYDPTIASPPVAIAVGSVLEVDDEPADDADSPGRVGDGACAAALPALTVCYVPEQYYDTATLNSSSRSLYADDLDYVVEHGRRYSGDYILPNDETEQDRQRLLHQVLLHTFGFRLTSVRLESPTYILDVGTGTGDWAIGMAEAFPGCEVVGVDHAPVQPSAVPHNVFFELDDCEIDWMRPEDSADLVHMRDMAGAFADWDFVYAEALKLLKPGGHLELLDFHDATSGAAASFLRYFPPQAAIHRYARLVDEAAAKAGRRRGAHHLAPARLLRAGFVDVRVAERALPLNARDDATARLWLVVVLHAVEAVALRLLTRHLGWDPARVFALCDAVCDEIKTRALDPAQREAAQVPLRILTARKPFRAKAHGSPLEAAAAVAAGLQKGKRAVL